MKNIYEVLNELGVDYKKYDHPPVYTCQESEKYTGHLQTGKDKNLFLRSRRGDTHYLVTVESSKKVDLKKLSSVLGESKLSFASPERLKKYLDLEPGSVTPFGLINDTKHEVKVVIDNGLIAHDNIQFHPNTNTSTIVVSREDFKRFLEWTGNDIVFVDV